MKAASIIEPTKTFIIEFKSFFFAAEFCKFSTTRPMLTVVRIVKTAAVMENGKQTHHVNVGSRFLGKQHSVVFHLMPMLYAMNLGLVEPILKSKVH